MRRISAPVLAVALGAVALSSIALLGCPPPGIRAAERRQGIDGDYVVADERKIAFCPEARLSASCAYAFPNARAAASEATLPLSGNLSTFKLLGEEGDFAFVESLPVDGSGAASNACYPGWSALAGTRLRGYIPKRALVSVTHDRVDRAFTDGTRFTLLPGVALFAQAEAGSYLAPLAGFDFLVEVPRDKVQAVFPGDPIPAPGKVISSISVKAPLPSASASALAASAGRSPLPVASSSASAVPASAPPVAGPPGPAASMANSARPPMGVVPIPVPFLLSGKPLFAEPLRAADGSLEPASLPIVEQRYLVDGAPAAVTHLRCAEVLGKVAGANFGGPLPAPPPREKEKGTVYVAVGERISWPNGTLAGATTEEFGLGDEVYVDAKGDVRCFRRPVLTADPRIPKAVPGAENSLILCFPRASIRVP
jgi:hypothetical protein